MTTPTIHGVARDILAMPNSDGLYTLDAADSSFLELGTIGHYLGQLGMDCGITRTYRSTYRLTVRWTAAQRRRLADTNLHERGTP